MTLFRTSLLLAGSLFLMTACSEDEEASPPAHWQLSGQYVFDTMILSNAVVKDAIANGQFMPLRPSVLNGAFVRYAQMAARMGLKRSPAIYLDTSDTRPVPQSAARFTREGLPYILVNRAALSLWNTRELIAVLGHELVHLKERHVTAERLAEAYNTPGLSARHELEADHIGAGPLGSCDPAALKSALEVVIAAEQKSVPEGTVETQGVPSDLTPADHPSWQIRKAALEAMMARPPEGCR